MKKIFALALASIALSACGSNDDDTPVPAPEKQATEPEPLKPAPLKVDPTLKPKFVSECEFQLGYGAASNKLFYTTLLQTSSATTCGATFDTVASKRYLTLGTGNMNALAPLMYFPFVERLEVLGLMTMETGQLANLKNLQFLSIHSSDVLDLTFLTYIPYLSTLVIENTPFTSLAPLAKIPNLRTFAFKAPKNASGKETLPKDEAHCPVLSARKALNDACKEYRGIK